MSREQFRYDGTKDLCKLIDEAGHRAGVCRGQAFEDFLTCVVCALSAQQMEVEYLEVVAKGYGDGEPGRRGIDWITQAFAKLVVLMEDTRNDILGDCFEGAITYGERGQFLTSPDLCELMARLNTFDDSVTDETVCDPCCGSGRMLLAYAQQKRPRELVGQDVDLRCVRMTAINLALRNMYGFVLWGDSLKNEVKLAYRTGQNIHGGFIRYARNGELGEKLGTTENEDEEPKVLVTPPSRPDGPMKQLGLF